MVTILELAQILKVITHQKPSRFQKRIGWALFSGIGRYMSRICAHRVWEVAKDDQDLPVKERARLVVRFQ